MSASASTHRPDRVTEGLRHFFGKLKNHSKLVLGSLLVLLAALGFAAFMLGENKENEGEAREALYDARVTLEKETKAFADASKPTSGKTKKEEVATPANPQDIAFQSLNVDEKFSESVKQLESVTQNFANTRAAHEARWELGNLYFNHGMSEKAEKWFQEASQKSKSKQDKTLALKALALTQENQKNFTGAIDSLKQAQTAAPESMQAAILLDLARNQELAGQLDDAKKTYLQIQTKYPGTDYAKDAEMAQNKLPQS